MSSNTQVAESDSLSSLADVGSVEETLYLPHHNQLHVHMVIHCTSTEGPP